MFESFNDFIAVCWQVVSKDSFGKNNNIKCGFCGAVIWNDGFVPCCAEMKNHISETLESRSRAIKRDEEMEKAERISAYNKNKAESGLEGFEKKATFKNYITKNSEQEIAKQMCRDYIESNKINLIISGSVGIGKTHLACATAQFYGFYNKASFGILRCSSTKIDDPEKYLNFDILIIDDIGRESGSEARLKSRMAMISEIIEHRHRNKMKTIYTTNLRMNEIPEKYGSHILDRMLDNAIIIKRLEGNSNRGFEKC